MRYEYISADNHLDSRWLPKDLWQQRLASKWLDRAPKVVETGKGSFWSWEGVTRLEAADGSSGDKLRKHYFPGIGFAGGELPPSNPALMLEHMDMARVYAGVFYGDTRKWAVDDKELRLAVFTAYNDFVMELNATSPDRLVVLPNLPTFAPEACRGELERMIKAGAKAVEFGCFDVGKPLYDAVWDPVFGLAAEAGVPICCHIGDVAGTAYPPNERGSSFAHFSTSPFALAKQIPTFVFCGAFERFPALQVSIAECRIGWLPFLISWMDRQAEVRPPDPSVPLKMKPSEYVARNMTFTFEEDYVGAKMIPHDWAHLKSSVIWGADYPHEQGTWPNPGPVLDRMFEGVDPKIKREILFDHSARLFKVGLERVAKAA